LASSSMQSIPPLVIISSPAPGARPSWAASRPETYSRMPAEALQWPSTAAPPPAPSAIQPGRPIVGERGRPGTSPARGNPPENVIDVGGPGEGEDRGDLRAAGRLVRAAREPRVPVAVRCAATGAAILVASVKGPADPRLRSSAWLLS